MQLANKITWLFLAITFTTFVYVFLFSYDFLALILLVVSSVLLAFGVLSSIIKMHNIQVDMLHVALCLTNYLVLLRYSESD